MFGTRDVNDMKAENSSDNTMGFFKNDIDTQYIIFNLYTMIGYWRTRALMRARNRSDIQFEMRYNQRLLIILSAFL